MMRIIRGSLVAIELDLGEYVRSNLMQPAAAGD